MIETEPSLGVTGNDNAIVAAFDDCLEQAKQYGIQQYRQHLLNKAEAKAEAARKQRAALERYEATGRLFA